MTVSNGAYSFRLTETSTSFGGEGKGWYGSFRQWMNLGYARVPASAGKAKAGWYGSFRQWMNLGYAGRTVRFLENAGHT